ncbi:dihydrofolate reductase [haloarchaeon 3A1-DGR]|nr:dihydrofolate reductase [haloarchaeon 3A1-DGR]
MEDRTDRDVPADRTDVDVPDDLTVSLIAAVAENGVIGDSGGMPWHYPADLEHFKRTTTGHPVILGRRTYESIAAQLGGPLPDRVSVVLSRSDLDLPDGAVGADGIEAALDRAAAAAADLGVETVYVAGGATIYEAFLPLADELVLTEIHESYAGDTRFPERDADEWTETDRDERDELTFRTYRRR